MRNAWCVAVMGLALGLCANQAGASTTVVGDGPLMRATLAALADEQGKSSPPTATSRDDWSAVTRLRPGTDIILTIRGLPAATRRLLSADAEELVVLDVTDPRLSKDIRQALRDIAGDRPSTLLAARSSELQLPRHIRVTPAGIFVEQQCVASLDDVIKVLPRTRIVDIRVRRKHIGTHSRRGFLIGAAIGAGVGAAIGASSGEELLPLAALGAGGGAVYGLEIGTVIGILAPRSPDVIYHIE